MLALVTSAKVVIGVVMGIPLITVALIVLATRPRLPRPAVGAASLVAVLLAGVAIWAVFRPAPPSLAAKAQLATLPSPGIGQPTAPVGPPPSAPPQTTTAPPPACSPSGTTVQVAAKGIAYDKSCLAAPAGAAFTVVFNNEDAGIPHNFEIFTNPSASKRLGGATGPTDFFSGPKSMTYQVGALPAGTYYFQCDVHPQQMHGTFVVR